MKLILENIKDTILVDLEKTTKLNCSLLGGHLGEIIFLYLYSKICPELGKKADLYLDKIFFSFRENTDIIFSYCNGISGFFIGLNYLQEKGFVRDVMENSEEIDTLVDFGLRQSLKTNHHDFLHGFIGMGFYYILRFPYKKEYCKNQLLKIVRHLRSLAIEDEKTIKWELKADSKYNISLSHGISATSLFLSQLLLLDFREEERHEIRNMVLKSVNYILQQEIDKDVYGSCFPMLPKEVGEIKKSRLAWCYGDLGIAMSLWNIGKIIKNNGIQQKAVEVFKYNSDRQDAVSNFVFDAELCHGAAGVAMIFHKIYKETGENCFKKAYDYWLSKIYEMARVDLSGMAHFDTYNPINNVWEEKCSILEGNAGIGLVLLSSKTEDWSWDKLLLI